MLLGYFGETLAIPCGNCDTCQGKVETWDGALAAQKALSCVWRTGQRFGASYLSDVLLGKPTERICRFGHDQVSTFGIGAEHSKKEWESVFRQLVAAGFLLVDLEGGGFRLSPQSRPVLKGDQKIRFRKDPAPVKKGLRFRSGNERRDEYGDPVSMGLWERLRGVRLEIAREKSVPPYVIFHDQTLKEMVASLPRSMAEMRRLYGVGQKKLNLYGNRFLKVIEAHIQEQGIPAELSDTREEPEQTPNLVADVSDSVSDTLTFFRKGMTSEEIAAYRELKVTTVYTHFEKAIEENEISVEEIVSLKKEDILEIEDAFRFQPPEEKGTLRPIFERFQEKYHYGILRCVRAGMLISENAERGLPFDKGKSYDIEDIRKVFPKAYAKWEEADDRSLKREYLKGKSVDELAEMLQRNPGAIRSRLKKWGLEPAHNIQKQIICLAASRKHSGYCIAGKEWQDGRMGQWLRPVSDREFGVLLINDILLDDGKLPKLLDILTCSLTKPVPHPYQSENHAIEKNLPWIRTGEISPSDLSEWCDDVGTLWINGHHSQHGFNDRIPEEIANESLSSSLVLVKPGNVSLLIQEEGYSKKIRAKFDFNGISYCLVVTDPAIERRYLKESAGEHPLNRADVYLTVSIGEPYNGYCYKLVAAII